MPSPFPGMNPYLEHPDRWSTVHNRLIVGLADLLTPRLLPKYQVDIDKRVYEVAGIDTIWIGRPDVKVQQSQTPRQMTEEASSVGVVSAPRRVTLPMLEEVREPYLEVRDVQTQAVVTALKILSPTNKRGDGRQKYLEKRAKILKSQTHLIEIDLLTQGETLPLAQGDVNSHYRILVSRSSARPAADLYAFDLPNPIPIFPLPLAPEDTEPTIDLQTLLEEVYQRSGYDYFIDYQQDVSLPLSTSDRAWIDACLQAQGGRDASS